MPTTNTDTLQKIYDAKSTGSSTLREVIIVGSGPAALSAAIYTARADLKPLVFASSVEPGGALTTTTDVDNFPGFEEGIEGPELMQKMQKQAERFGAEVVYADVTELELTGAVKRVTVKSGVVHESRTVIYATGSEYRKLGIPLEDELTGYGVSFCATCDGFFFRNQVVAVVGGGDTALEEALFLTKYASKVYLIHRRDDYRASKAVQERVFVNEKIIPIFNSEVISLNDALGADEEPSSILEHATVRNVETGETQTLHLAGLFVAIGADPRTHLIHGQLDLTTDGVIAVEGRSSRTSLPGVFAAGDVVDSVYKQAGIAAGSGIVAALDAESYIQLQKESER